MAVDNKSIKNCRKNIIAVYHKNIKDIYHKIVIAIYQQNMTAIYHQHWNKNRKRLSVNGRINKRKEAHKDAGAENRSEDNLVKS